MYYKTLNRTVFLYILLIGPNLMKAQLPKWIVGSSQQNASGTFYSYGTGNLKFYELNFSGTLFTTPRIIGNSIQSIKSVGTQDVIQTAVDTSSNTVLFYAFIAALGPYNAGFPAINPDTVYFSAYNSSTSADEIFGKIPTTGWGASVLESELIRKPGSISEYYFIYKTQATSLYYDNIRYVTIDAVSKTVSAPIDIVTATKSGEGMAVSQLDCSTNQRWLFVTRPETSGNITLRKCSITNSGISLPTDIYTVSISGNSIGVIGAIEISPTNDKLAIANFTTASVAKNLILFDYNNAIGAVSNEYSYTNQSGGPFVTMEFSPNSSRIYILQGGASGYSNVVYNCPVVSSNYTVTSANLMTGMTLINSLTLELAYDGKIYVNQGESSNFIYYIPNPNSTSLSVLSTAANFFGVNQQMGSGFPDQVDGDRNPNNTINASISPSSTSICIGQSVTLTASGGTTYQWSGGSSATSSTITLSPTVTTTYYLQASNGSCIDNDSITIQVNSVPVASISGNQNICSGQSSTLTANGASSYQWSGGSTATTASISVAPTTTTNYILTPSNGTCQGNPITVIVNVTPMPSASISPTSTSICNGQSVTLNASGGTTYQWSGGSSATSSTITLSPAVTTTYYLQASNGSCINNDSITIQVNSVPVAAISGNQIICSGQNTILTASGANFYQWSGGSNAITDTISITPSTTTNYIVTPSNGSCQGNPVSIMINVNPAPTADAGIDQTITAGNTAVLNGNGGGNYLWSPSTGLDCSTCQNTIANPLQTTIYSLTVTDTNGCSSIDWVTVEINCGELFVPTAFSPNDDTENNFECVYGKCIQAISFVIFDRWGEKVFETSDQSLCWDGTYKGQKLDAAVFVYFLKATLISGEEVFKKGNIFIVK
ncbi:MAG: hypothetical protein A3F72_18560 [Bacteroidetes bacterium RIFCSPLOWO2_12_FULL_35_15]|nr:MAG: hypothetical protein A3F72_18560 [Bacteroidetes bacterium RIFCSPLOWO2_12_FULL_35_15]